MEEASSAAAQLIIELVGLLSDIVESAIVNKHLYETASWKIGSLLDNLDEMLAACEAMAVDTLVDAHDRMQNAQCFISIAKLEERIAKNEFLQSLLSKPQSRWRRFFNKCRSLGENTAQGMARNPKLKADALMEILGDADKKLGRIDRTYERGYSSRQTNIAMGVTVAACTPEQEETIQKTLNKNAAKRRLA